MRQGRHPQFPPDCPAPPREQNPNARFGVRDYALDPVRADALWALSEHMVGEKF